MATARINTRLAAVRDLMAAKSLEALVVAGSEIRRYLSGFTARDELLSETSGWLLITSTEELSPGTLFALFLALRTYPP